MSAPTRPAVRTRHIAIVLYPDVEVLDFAGPYEVFTCASRMALRDAAPATPPPFAVHTVAGQAGPVRARAGLQVLADAGMADSGAVATEGFIEGHERTGPGVSTSTHASAGPCPPPPIDWLIVPGGVVDAARTDGPLLRWLRQTAARAEGVASVCTGAFLLADAGLLPDGLAVTTHWEDAADLQRDFPALDVRPDRRVIDRGDRITSAGISAGMDMALHLVERLAGRALAQRTARQMDVVWTRTNATA